MTFLRRLVALVLVVVLAVLAGLGASHWYRGGSPADAMHMAVQVMQVAAHCPRQPESLLRSAERSKAEAKAVGIANDANADWDEAVCSGVLLQKDAWFSALGVQA